MKPARFARGLKLLSRMGGQNAGGAPGKNDKKTSKNAKISEANYSRKRAYGPGRAGSGQEQAKGLNQVVKYVTIRYERYERYEFYAFLGVSYRIVSHGARIAVAIRLYRIVSFKI